ncbi:hypothetical protein HZB03_01405 [Candidatus Woesearchaeota archaeon]|nr:hypothetical protein [Candidatus Woesearchaeota archaeon]
MTFTNDEKKLLAALVKEHLAEITADEKRGDQPAQLLKGETKYSEFLQGLMKKLK